MSIESIKKWFELAVPNPTDKNRAVQIGCHFEEVCEMIDAIGEDSTSQADDLAEHYKKFVAGVKTNKPNRQELADSLADQIVTAIGVAHMFGIDIAGALAEVDRSNYSKFVDGKPVFNEHGKIAKGPNYSKADLSKFY